MNKLNVALLGAVLFAFPVTGCSKLKAAQKAAEALKAAAAAASSKVADKGAAEAAKPADPELEKDSDLGEKLGEYIECLNYASKSVHDSRRRYLEWANEKTGPTGKERHVYGLYEVRGDDCVKAIDKAKALKPQLAEIEANAEEYKAALQALTPLIAAAQKYYSQQDFKDDKMAKGKEMHGPLIAAFTKFETANQGFESKVTKMNDDLGARMLERMSKDPSMRLQYLTKKSLADAKALILLADVGTLKDLDLAKIEAGVQTYDKSITELEGYCEAQKAECGKVSMLSSMVREERELLKAGKDLMRRKRDNKDFNKEFFSGSNPKLVEGHPAQVIDKYNTVVRSSNHLRF